MKKRQNALVAVTAAASLFTLTACGGGGTATTEGAEFSEDYSGTLTAWGFPEPDEVAQSRIDLADDKLAESDTEVDLDNSPFDAQKFTTLAASGNIPDVVVMDRQFVTTYASQGLIMPIDDCFALYDIDPREYWYPQVVDDVTWDDEVWAVPQFYQPPAIMLNARVMGETGVTPEQLNVSDQDAFLAAVEKMTVMNGQNPTRLGFDPQGPSKAGLWMLSFGGSTIGEDGEPTLDNPKNAEAIDFLKKIYDLQGGYANVKSFVDSFDVFGENNSFVADQVGAAIFDQWYVNVLTSYAEQVDIGAIPVVTQEGEPFTVASGTSVVIPAASKNPSAACDWALTLTSLEAWEAAGAARAETTEADPGRNGINAGLFTGSPEADQTIRESYVKETGYAGFDQAIATYYDVASSGASFGSSPAGQQIQSELQNAVTSALLGEKSAADALADAQSAAQRAYDQVAG
ncbi:ABC transporter substrate-binding protein [Micromonospora sp. DT81.3]|uniref:ABC transporter substrate-binding protein n=1 Tax=Actinomycetes TaxID=1760 RepID=UPI003CEC28CA